MPAWANLTVKGAPAPPGRFFSTSEIYDPADHYVLLFGGYTSRLTYLNDTWTFAGGTWTNITPNPSPAARDHSTMAYDAADGYVVLFGGANATTSLNDTWTFRAGVWTHVVTPVAPSPRWASVMAYSSRDREVVLFGGCKVTEMNDTWTFRAGVWTKLALSVAPSPRGEASFAFDPVDDALTLYGGEDGPTVLGDTWWFQSGQWLPLLPPMSPSPRHSASFVFDSTLGVMVLFGGSTLAGLMNETWWFVHRDWQNASASPAPAPREFAIMANDTQDGYLLVFGGGGAGSSLFNDTWAYDAFVARAAGSPVGGLAPLSVAFTEVTNLGFAPYSAAWEFGDGGAGAGPLAVHTYLYGGVFQATLTVTDRFAARSVAVLTVVVAGPLAGTLAVAGTAAPSSTVVGSNVSFVAIASSGQPPYRYQWAFGDGATTTGADVSHEYPRSGTYAPVVTVWDRYNSSTTSTLSVSIAPALAVTWAAAATVGASPFRLTASVNVTGGFAPYSINWSWGDGSYSTGARSSHTYHAAATYGVVLAVTDARNDHASGSLNVQVNPGPNTAFGGFGAYFSGPGGLLIVAMISAAVGGAAGVWVSRRRERTHTPAKDSEARNPSA